MVDLGFTNDIAKIASTDLFERDSKDNELRSGLYATSCIQTSENSTSTHSGA